MPNTPVLGEFPESLKKPFATLTTMNRSMATLSGADYEKAFITTAINAFEEYRIRVAIDPGPGYYRPITPERKEGINQFYEKTALSMYNGFVKRMAVYAEKGDTRQKHLASLFSKAQN